MYKNTFTKQYDHNNSSFEYVTPNSRIVPPPSSTEYHVNIESWRQPARSSSLQKPQQQPFERESLIDPSGYDYYHPARETVIEPNISALVIDSVNEDYYLNQTKSPNYPHSPVPNMNYYNNLQSDQPYHDPQIQTVNPPKSVKSNVHTQQAYVQLPQPSVAVYEEVSQNSNFSLQPVPHNKKVNPVHYNSTIDNYNNDTKTYHYPVVSASVSTSRSTTNTRLPKPPLTPLVIPPTPSRSSSSPNRTLFTPTRTSSMQNHPLPTPGGLSTPGSSHSANSPSGLSPFTCSPSTPSPNTLHPHAMLPSPLSSAPHNNVENGIKKALSSKKLSMQPEGEAERLVHQGIKFHEAGKLEQATDMFKQASQLDLPIAMFLYGVSLRHGWGCKKSEHLAFQYLQKAAEHAVEDLNTFSTTVSTSAAKGELIMAIYELGVSFRHGWGCKKNKETAVYYFKIAADLNDPDAQNDLGHCYYHGHGVKKDLYLAAKYYRLADKQGQGIMGNSWIWKSKYDKPSK